MANIRRMVRGCYAAALGDCAGRLCREHFISKNLLKEFEEAGRLKVVGYPFGNDAGDLLMSAESMSAKVLCEAHNSRLSDVDTEGGRFILAFFRLHVDFAEQKIATDTIYEFDGLLIERWMLKYACGKFATGQAAVGKDRLDTNPPPPEFLQVLFGIETLPSEWGLYSRPANSTYVSERKEIGLGLLLPRAAQKPLNVYDFRGVILQHYGFTSTFLLETPQKPLAGLLEGAFYHPEYFTFYYAPTGRSATVRIKWSEPTQGAGFVIELHKGEAPADLAVVKTSGVPF